MAENKWSTAVYELSTERSKILAFKIPLVSVLCLSSVHNDLYRADRRGEPVRRDRNADAVTLDHSVGNKDLCKGQPIGVEHLAANAQAFLICKLADGLQIVG